MWVWWEKQFPISNFPSFYADSRRGGRSSAADLKKLVAEARAQKIEGLVLDLSNNGGGSLEDAVKIAGLFFQTGSVVKQTTHDNGKGEINYKDLDPQVDWSGPFLADSVSQTFHVQIQRRGAAPPLGGSISINENDEARITVHRFPM